MKQLTLLFLLPLFFLSVPFSKAQVAQQDFEALRDLYNSNLSLQGSLNWDFSSNTVDNSWNGLRTENNRVTMIFLSYSGLTTLPTSFGNLSGLEYLDVQRNQLTNLPETFGNLSSLQKLYISFNQLTNFPDSFGNLSNLRELYSEYNQLIDLSNNFGSLSSLQRLDLIDNQLSELPSSFSNLSSLQYLNVGNNQLIDLPSDFGSLSSLEELFIINNQLVGLPSSFGNLSSLEELSILNNQLTSLSINFGNLSSLQTLNLRDNQLAELPNSFGNLSSLQYLYLRNNQLTTLPNSFGNLFNLQVLEITRNQLTSLPDSFFDNLPRLWNLELFYNQLETLPNRFDQLPSLRRLSLEYNQLRDVPESLILSNPTYININNNLFQFDPLENLINNNFAFFTSNSNRYSPQGKYLTEDVQGILGQSIQLDGTVTGTVSQTTYKWFKRDGNNIIELPNTDPILTIPISAAADEGTYYCEARNGIVTGLVLTSEDIEVTLSEDNTDSGECQNLVLVNVSSLPSSVANDLDASNSFGRDRVLVGDIDGNGVNDMLVYGKKYSDPPYAQYGSALFHVLFMNADGTVLRSQTSQENVFGFYTSTYEPQERISSVTSLGYVNGKHYIAVDAMGVFAGSRRVGAMGVGYIDSNGYVRKSSTYTYDELVQLNYIPSVFTGVDWHQQPRMGYQVEKIGDVDGNGMPDVAVHAKMDGCYSPCYGKLVVVLLNTDGTMLKAKDYWWADNASIKQPEMYAVEMATIGDVDGDGIPDIATASPNRSTEEDLSTVGVTNRGAVYINFLNADGSVRDIKRIEHNPSEGIDLPINSAFGVGLTSIGDIDGNGVNDLIVLDAFKNLHILSLDRTGSVIHYQKIDQAATDYYTIDSYPPTNLSTYLGLDQGDDRDGDGIHDVFVKGLREVLKLSFNRECLDIVKECEGTFQKEYYSEEDVLSTYGKTALTTEDGYLILGQSIDQNYSAFISLKKIDKQGNEIWTKNYGENGKSIIGNHIAETQDGAYIITGNTGGNSVGKGVGAVFLKVDSNGNVIWQKTILKNEVVNYSSYQIRANYTITLKNGEYFSVGQVSTGNGDMSFLGKGCMMKLDSDGNLLWLKIVNTGVSEGSTKQIDVPTSFNQIEQVGNNRFLISAQSTFVYVDSDGNELDAMTPLLSTRNRNFTLGDNGEILIVEKTNSFSSDVDVNIILSKIDENQNFIFSKKLNFPIKRNKGGTLMIASNSDKSRYAIIGQSEEDNKPIILLIDNEGNKIWSKSFGKEAYQANSIISTGEENGFLVTGNTGYKWEGGSEQTFVLKICDQLICSSTDIQAELQDIETTTKTSNFEYIQIDTELGSALAIYDAEFTDIDACEVLSECEVQIDGWSLNISEDEFGIVTNNSNTNWGVGGHTPNIYLKANQDGYLELDLTVKKQSSRYVYGFSTNPTNNYQSLNYSFFHDGGRLKIYDNNTFFDKGTIDEGDKLRIERVRGEIIYWRKRTNEGWKILRRTLDMYPNEKFYVTTDLKKNSSTHTSILSTCVSEVYVQIKNSLCEGGLGSVLIEGKLGINYTYQINNNTAVAFTGQTTIGPLADGSYSLTVKNTNTNEVKVFDIYLQSGRVEFTTSIETAQYNSQTGELSVFANKEWEVGGYAHQSVLTSNQNGYIEIDLTQRRTYSYYMTGLSSNPNSHYNTLDYAFYHNGNELLIYELGNQIGDSRGNILAGDKLRIERFGNQIIYLRKRNGQPWQTIHTTNTDPNKILTVASDLKGNRTITHPVYLNSCITDISVTPIVSNCPTSLGSISINGTDGTSYSYSLDGGTTWIDFTSNTVIPDLADGLYSVSVRNNDSNESRTFDIVLRLGGVDLSGSTSTLNPEDGSLTGQRGDGWGSGGYSSEASLLAEENGYIEFKINERRITSYYMIGLDQAQNINHTTFDYAFYHKGRDMFIREDNQQIGNSYGQIVRGDIYRIERSFGSIIYWKKSGRNGSSWEILRRVDNVDMTKSLFTVADLRSEGNGVSTTHPITLNKCDARTQFCSNDVNLSILPRENYDYIWYDIDNEVVSTGTEYNTRLENGNYTFMVVGTNPTTSESYTTTYTIEVNAIEVLNIAGNSFPSQGETITLEAILGINRDITGFTFIWKDPNGVVIPLSDLSNPLEVTISDVVSGIYTLTVSSEQGCEVVYTKEIKIVSACNSDIPIPVLDIDFSKNYGYRELTDKLSASYYTTTNEGILNFTYKERYKNGKLVCHIYNWERCEIGLIDLDKSIGTNWYSLNLMGVCTENEFYLMEVYDENDHRTVLNFQYRYQDMDATLSGEQWYCSNDDITYTVSIENGQVDYVAELWVQSEGASPNDWMLLDVKLSQETQVEFTPGFDEMYGNFRLKAIVIDEWGKKVTTNILNIQESEDCPKNLRDTPPLTAKTQKINVRFSIKNLLQNIGNVLKTR